MTRTLPTPVHIRPAYASCGRSPYVATFRKSSTGLDGCTAPEKKCSRLHLSAPLSGPRDPPQFLSQHSHWSSALKPSTCRRQTTRLTGLISPACDRYVQYLLTGTNPSILNRRRWGIPHRKPWSSHNTLPALPFRGKQALNLTSGSLHSTSIVTYQLRIAWANNAPPR
jgi:hypothetical protein